MTNGGKMQKALAIILSIFIFSGPIHSYAEEGQISIQSEPSVQLKRKVAIARFTNETQSGTSFLIDDSGDRVGKQASDILSARLSDTGKFLMFERIDSEKTSTEKLLAGLKDEGVSVDYLILGSVSEFGRSTESESGIFSRSKKQSAYAKVNVRLVDVTTGRIIHSSEGAGTADSQTKKTLGAGTSAGYDQSLNDKALSAAISQLSMSSKPWRSYFLSEDDGSYIIAGGATQGLSPGLLLTVYSKGKSIKNPQTGAMIELPGKNVGEITVLATMGDDEFNELSYASLTQGSLTKKLENYYIQQT